MKLYIGKNIRIQNPNANIKMYCGEKLVKDNPDYLSAMKIGRYVGNIERYINLFYIDGDCYVLPFGCLKDVLKLSVGSEYELLFHKRIGNNLKGHIDLFGYQQLALEELLKEKNGILEAPCGSGKTQIGLALIKENGGRALWLTHTKKLLTQSMERAKRYYSGDFGTITEGNIKLGKDITFATVQTMSKIDTSVYENAFDIIVVDECHHAVGSPTRVRQFYKVISNCNARYKYGLSATLERADGLIDCAYKLIGDKIYTITKEEVGNKIIKAIHKKIEWTKKYDLTQYCNGDGTINYNNLINLLSNDFERNEFIVDKVKDLYIDGKKQMILCHRVSQVEMLTQMISNCGIDCCSMTSKVKEGDRDFEKRVIVATYSLAKEGLDIVDLDVVNFATPHKDKTIVEQSAGRVERNIEGKKTPFVYDYVDTDIDYCNVCYYKRRNILKKY